MKRNVSTKPNVAIASTKAVVDGGADGLVPAWSSGERWVLKSPPIIMWALAAVAVANCARRISSVWCFLFSGKPELSAWTGGQYMATSNIGVVVFNHEVTNIPLEVVGGQARLAR